MQVLRSLPWTVNTVQKGRGVLHADASSADLYVLETGWAAHYSIRRDGTRRITGLLMPGDVCGERASSERRAGHGIVALTCCEIASVRSDRIEDASDYLRGFRHLLWQLKLVEEATLRVWMSVSRDAFEALAHLICELHARADAVGDVRDGRLRLPITQEQIGDALGITSVHTSRMVGKLRACGLADVFEGYVRIPNIAALHAACAFTPAYLGL